MWTNAYSVEDVGEFLKDARKEEGITQAQMAKKLGFSPVTLSALETGKNVSSQKIELYLQMLGYRIVIVPKSAKVKVSELGCSTSTWEDRMLGPFRKTGKGPVSRTSPKSSGITWDPRSCRFPSPLRKNLSASRKPQAGSTAFYLKDHAAMQSARTWG